MNVLAIVAVVAAIIGLAVAVGLASWIGKQAEGTDRMKEIAGYIREGAMALQDNGHRYHCSLRTYRSIYQAGNRYPVCIRSALIGSGRLLRNEGGYAG